MKKIFFLLLTISLLSISYLTFGQLSKEDCQEIIESVDMASYKYTSVDFKNELYKFDPLSITFTFKQTYFIVKDADEKTLFIPYDKVKIIKAMPAFDNYSKSFKIYVID